MRHLIFAGLMATATGASAQAAEWTGFYVGGHLGYGFDKERSSGSASVTPSPEGAFLFEPGGISEIRSSAFQSRFRSFLGGVQLGYNFQYGQFVFGAEGDVTFGNLSTAAGTSNSTIFGGALTAAGANALNMNPGDVISLSTDTRFAARHRLGTFGTLRGRLGYTFDRYLVYVTAGVAVADLETSATSVRSAAASANVIAANPFFAVLLGTSSASAKTSRFAGGSVVGAGLEAALTRNWSVKAEYLFLALPNQSISVAGNFQKFGNNFHVARIGVNYRF